MPDFTFGFVLAQRMGFIMNKFNKYYLIALSAVVAASAYPAYMGVKVVSDMICFGTVYAESYPKYVIPYAPIALALIIGTAFMPLLFRTAKKYALAAGSLVSLAVFFSSELLIESQVIVTTTCITALDNWQMYMCYVPPEGYGTRTWTEVNVLMGEYSPAFKIHFYVISVILILSLLNCVYGFADMIKSGDGRRKKALIIQSVSSLVFLGLCILACFTAFFRTGELTVSPLSAALMIVYFITMGITFGVYVGSFLPKERKGLCLALPAVVSAAVTTLMYIGELILLSGHLYRFGSGFFFNGLGALVLAPVDICVILVSGGLCLLISAFLRANKVVKPVNNEL